MGNYRIRPSVRNQNTYVTRRHASPRLHTKTRFVFKSIIIPVRFRYYTSTTFGISNGYRSRRRRPY